MSGVKVHIRHSWEPDATYFCDVPFADVEDVISTLRHWGLGGGCVPDDPQLTGQFVYDEDGDRAYFEVVIHEEGE